MMTALVLGPWHSSSYGQLLQEQVQAVAAVKDGDGVDQSSPLALAIQEQEGGLVTMPPRAGLSQPFHKSSVDLQCNDWISE